MVISLRLVAVALPCVVKIDLLVIILISATTNSILVLFTIVRVLVLSNELREKQINMNYPIVHTFTAQTYNRAVLNNHFSVFYVLVQAEVFACDSFVWCILHGLDPDWYPSWLIPSRVRPIPNSFSMFYPSAGLESARPLYLRCASLSDATGKP
jgi:hypothetical protein